MRKYTIVLLFLILIAPSVALASWWNPTTWKIFSFLHKKNQAESVQNIISKDDEIAILEKRLNELKGQKPEENSGNATTSIEDKAALIASIKSQVASELKQKANEDVVVGREKTLSEKVGVSRESLASCVKATDNTALQNRISASVEAAMKGLPMDQRGTPYAVVIGPNGVKTEIRGAMPYEEVKKAINEVLVGNVTNKYTGEISEVTSSDHIKGSLNAKVKIVEYSDLECPYCKIFHETLKRVVNEGSGQVSWIYRHWPIHQNSFEKLVATECVAKIKGNSAFWSYLDLIFGMMNQQVPVSEKL